MDIYLFLDGPIPQFLCSGLLIASKYKTKVLSEFIEFEEHGTWPTDCISKYYKLEPSTSFFTSVHNQMTEGQKFMPSEDLSFNYLPITPFFLF